MKKYLVIILVVWVLLVGVFVGLKIVKDEGQGDEIVVETESEVKTREEIIRDFVDDVLEHMTLEQKVGQMLIVRNSYTAMTPEYEAEIMEVQPGGYIIFDENITTLAETQQLVSDIRVKIEGAGSVVLEDGTIYKIPAIMSVDQEGGLVQRLQAISDYPPEYVRTMSEVGASGSTEEAYGTGLLLAEECKSLGLNVDYAPVADIFSNPYNTVIGSRAFGADKETVATMAVALARGLNDGGVVPVYKHFPGHGDTVADSHESLPVVTKTLDELMQDELYPFRKAIEAGAEMIMVAHIALPNVTGDYAPASLSSVITTDILKEKLGYNGLVITDGLDMGALTGNYSNAEIAVGAVNAGADLLLTPVAPVEAKNAIVAAVRGGTIGESRIDESVAKILELKIQHFDQETLGELAW